MIQVDFLGLFLLLIVIAISGLAGYFIGMANCYEDDKGE